MSLMNWQRFPNYFLYCHPNIILLNPFTSMCNLPTVKVQPAIVNTPALLITHSTSVPQCLHHKISSQIMCTSYDFSWFCMRPHGIEWSSDSDPWKFPSLLLRFLWYPEILLFFVYLEDPTMQTGYSILTWIISIQCQTKSQKYLYSHENCDFEPIVWVSSITVLVTAINRT